MVIVNHLIGTSRKSQKTSYKIQINLKYQIPMPNKPKLSVILFENLKIGFWKLFVI